MNIPQIKRYALACAALLGVATCLAGEVVLDEASSEPVGLNNLEVKTAATVENLKLPESWGDTNAPTLVIEGVAKSAEGTNYVWQTGPLFPQYYTVKLSYGGEEYEALFDVAALAAAEWGTIDLDNVTPRVAKGTENLSLPAAWGEDATGLKLVWTDELGEHEKALDAAATSYAWSTLPLMPGAYGVKLSYGGKETTVAEYTVSSLGEAVAESGTSIDNAYDTDPAGADVRDIANHTNGFKLAWVGAGTPELTLDGEATGVEPDADGNWAWETNGLTYALYTFTNTVDGSNYVARFRVNADKVAVLFGGNTNNVLVAKTWYAEKVQELGVTDSRKVISDALKEQGDNTLPLWKSYVLGVDPDATLSFESGIRMYGSDPVQRVRYDEEGGTNIYYMAFTTNNIVVWPMVDTSAMPSGTQADIIYTLKVADTVTSAFETVKRQANDPELTEKFGMGEESRGKRFYKTGIDVKPTAKQ